MSRARSQSDLVVVNRWPKEWSKQSLCVSLYVVRRVVLRVGKLSDTTDVALEVGKRSNCRGLHVTSDRTKKHGRNWIMVASRDPTHKSEEEENEECVARTAKVEHILKLRLDECGYIVRTLWHFACNGSISVAAFLTGNLNLPCCTDVVLSMRHTRVCTSTLSTLC